MLLYNFLSSLCSLLIPLFGGFYFIYKWHKTKQNHQYLLSFGLCLLFIQLFKLPNILINAGFEISQAILNPYFLVTLCLYLVSFYFLTSGFLIFYQQKLRIIKTLFLSLISILIIYYFISFFIPTHPLYLPVWLGHVFFFIPAQFITLFVFYKTTSFWHRYNLAKSKFFISCSLYLLFSASVAYIYVQTGPFTHLLWYVNVIMSWGISVLQIFAMIFLFLGLYFMAKSKIPKL
jgi:hypothetical protein